MANKPREMSIDDLTQWLGDCQPGSAQHGILSAELQRRQYLNSQRSTTIAIWAAVASAVSAVGAWAAVLHIH